MEENVVKPGKVDVKLATYDSYETAVSDMLAGRLNAVDLDDTTAQTWISKGRPIKSVGKIFLRAPMAPAVKTGDSRPILAQPKAQKSAVCGKSVCHRVNLGG